MNSKHSLFYLAAVVAIVLSVASAPRAAFAGGDSSSMDPSVTPADQGASGASQTPADQGASKPAQTPADQGASKPLQTPADQGGSSQPGSSFYLQNPLSSKFSSVGGLVEGFLEILSYIAVLLAVLMLIWTGLQFVMAQGEPKRLNELKTQLLWIVIGVALVIGARIIVTVAIETLKSTGAVSPNTIQSAQNALHGNNP